MSGGYSIKDQRRRRLYLMGGVACVIVLAILNASFMLYSSSAMFSCMAEHKEYVHDQRPSQRSNTAPLRLGISTQVITPLSTKAGPSYMSTVNQDFLLFSLLNKSKYAQYHGYDFLPNFWNYHGDLAGTWSKQSHLIDNLHRYDWMWQIDADAFIMNRDIAAHKYFDLLNTDKDLVFSFDCNTINAGVFFIKNSPWSHRFLAEWWALRNDETVPRLRVLEDNAALAYMWWNNDTIKERTLLVDTKKLNSYVHDCAHIWQEGDFILHFAGVDQKPQRFSQIICEAGDKLWKVLP